MAGGETGRRTDRIGLPCAPRRYLRSIISGIYRWRRQLHAVLRPTRANDIGIPYARRDRERVGATLIVSLRGFAVVAVGRFELLRSTVRKARPGWKLLAGLITPNTSNLRI